ncbi:alpha-glucuronidase family glycosyl hydrolase [Sphingomonas sp. DG1-23]|uniref:alpha-glucuronidase family glycosyl hydrolase n=1 Tax=Sphingomonas sp. DG1-23 TaxID=3068316 RepID=UPI00273D27D3|nr:alpha-glucuronidase family glycosyl hydrolase [Sphingomonas sp. DG1-23]MDP5280308.1 alpha-glucuronidase family glycosyl hydrolase [Sphingomonas sp. DG1-23]
MRRLLAFLILVLSLALPPGARAETGYDLWLRYRPVEAPWQERYAARVTHYTVAARPTVIAAANELRRGVEGMLGYDPVWRETVMGDGAVVLGTGTSPLIAPLGLPLTQLGPEGYLIRSATIQGKQVTVIAANGDVGVLYGVFRFLKLMQMRQPIDNLDISEAPKLKLRVLNHWDNLDRYVERGYAGESIWDWQKLPGYKDPRYVDYARANASIGINGTVLTNVNANADALRPEWLAKVKALAEIFRPYGIRVYLTARFSAPIELGGLKTADPLDPQVAGWWKAKVDEIYRVIPDFGGFLVKANSEGQPGPSDYKRSHAEGANMLADALAPHNGTLMWRAFVYAAENPDDRHKQAYAEFHPLDGKFRDNVLVQVKNGAIDFQPREPFHPLFGAMPKTPLMMEFQITKEYLGFATHLAYLGTMWEEALQADTFRPHKGSTVAELLEAPVDAKAATGMAGVANIGSDLNWSGSQFDQANWYAFGRFAWDPEAKAEPVARDWAAMTWGSDPAVTGPIVAMMMGSREAVVDYMTPLGLGHLMATGHHYGPGPWIADLARPEWNPVYYHKADAAGIGFDRTARGTNAVGQYAPAVAAIFGDRKRVPEQFLLWFHHLPWDYRTRSGRILWDELVTRYDRGVDAVKTMQAEWDGLKDKVDERRWAEVRDFLAIQRDEAQWWRDASVAYFQSVSKRPLPAGHAAPAHDLDWYKAIKTPYAPGNGK